MIFLTACLLSKTHFSFQNHNVRPNKYLKSRFILGRILCPPSKNPSKIQSNEWEMCHCWCHLEGLMKIIRALFTVRYSKQNVAQMAVLFWVTNPNKLANNYQIRRTQVMTIVCNSTNWKWMNYEQWKFYLDNRYNESCFSVCVNVYCLCQLEQQILNGKIYLWYNLT